MHSPQCVGVGNGRCVCFLKFLILTKKCPFAKWTVKWTGFCTFTCAENKNKYEDSKIQIDV